MDDKMLLQLLDISRSMAETRVLDPLLDSAMNHALELVGAERGYLVLLKEDRTLDFRVKIDHKGNILDRPEEQISYTILNKVITTKQPQVIADAVVDPSFSKSVSVNALQLRSVMCVPLIARGQTLGAIFVENKSEMGMFTKENLLPLTYFASQAAISIENAILNDELEARVATRTAELEEAMARVEQSWGEAVEANRMRTTLYARITHDIRSPLSLIVSALSMIADGEFGELNEDQQEWINTSLSSADHVVRLTNDFFDLTKSDIGQLKIFKEDTDLRALLKRVREVCDILPWADGVAFKLEIDDEFPDSAFLDSTRIQQVIFNLVSNASKFTEQGEVILRAGVTPEYDGLLISVSDTGPGIAEEQLEQIFDRFVQVGDNSSQRKGTGLGLAICHELVALHDGEIWAESEMSVGTTFYFTVPQ